MRELRGRKKLQLIHELARGEEKIGVLARRHKMSIPEIRAFKRANAYDITLVRTDIENEFAGMWITKKRDRLAETQEVVERANAQLEAWDELVETLRDALDNPGDFDPKVYTAAKALLGGRGDVRSPAPELMKVVLKALRQGAEEMGDLKQDINMNLSNVRSEIVGINTDDLS